MRLLMLRSGLRLGAVEDFFGICDKDLVRIGSDQPFCLEEDAAGMGFADHDAFNLGALRIFPLPLPAHPEGLSFNIKRSA